MHAPKPSPKSFFLPSFLLLVFFVTYYVAQAPLPHPNIVPPHTSRGAVWFAPPVTWGRVVRVLTWFARAHDPRRALVTVGNGQFAAGCVLPTPCPTSASMLDRTAL